jgi:acyl-CoA reductase-like NAD-dependent aldehyde dehydrogenase
MSQRERVWDGTLSCRGYLDPRIAFSATARKRHHAVARRLDAGMVWINQHLNLHPNIPFSGHKNSGIGIEFGEDGLKEFCNVQVIANNR